LPVKETSQVLGALTRLSQDQRRQVLSATIAFFGIGNAELNAIK
jgi:hypothetical protein